MFALHQTKQFTAPFDRHVLRSLNWGCLPGMYIFPAGSDYFRSYWSTAAFGYSVAHFLFLLPWTPLMRLLLADA